MLFFVIHYFSIFVDTKYNSNSLIVYDSFVFYEEYCIICRLNIITTVYANRGIRRKMAHCPHAESCFCKGTVFYCGSRHHMVQIIWGCVWWEGCHSLRVVTWEYVYWGENVLEKTGVKRKLLKL